MNRNRKSKQKIILALAITIIAILLFWLALRFVVSRGLIDEQFGDTGGWGGDEDNESFLSIGDKEYITNDDIEVYVAAGTDGGGTDKGEGYNGQLADFISVILIDNTTEKYAFYLIDRNTMVDVPVINKKGDIEDFAQQQVCTAHWYGFDEEQRNDILCMAVSETVGSLDTNGYYVINMEDVGAVNDAIGGVTVDIDTDMTNLDPAFTQGASVHLEGKQAENYLRARMDVGDGTNAGRMERQLQYVQKAYSMVIDQLRENPEYVNDLYALLEDKVESDGNDKRVSQIADKLMRYKSMGFITFTGKVKVNDTIGEGITHEEFYQDPASVLAGLRKVVDIREDDSSDEDDEDVDDEDEADEADQ